MEGKMTHMTLLAALLCVVTFGAQADTHLPDETIKLGRCNAAFGSIGFYKEAKVIYGYARDLTLSVEDRELGFDMAAAFGEGVGSYLEMLATLKEKSPKDAKATALEILNEKGCYELVISIDAAAKTE